ncbi:uncharacterized protein LOC114590119 isoform X1 [Podarcis muralis]
MGTIMLLWRNLFGLLVGPENGFLPSCCTVWYWLHRRVDLGAPAPLPDAQPVRGNPPEHEERAEAGGEPTSTRHLPELAGCQVSAEQQPPAGRGIPEVAWPSMQTIMDLMGQISRNLKRLKEIDKEWWERYTGESVTTSPPSFEISNAL